MDARTFDLAGSDALYDLCVIGAGMAGLSAARAAASRGARVVLIERQHRVGGRVRTVYPAWAAKCAVETGPEFVDANHTLLRDACARAGVTLREVGGELHSFRDDVLAPASRHPSNDPAELRLQRAYWSHIAAVADGIDDPDAPQHHPNAAALDAEPITALFARVAASVDAPPRAVAQLGRFVQGVLGAEPENVSALFVAQQAALEGGGSSARVDEGLDAVARHLAAELAPHVEFRFGQHIEHFEQREDDTVVVRMARGSIRARRVVLAVPLGALAKLAWPGMPDVWRAAANTIRYGSLVKASIFAPDVALPGWAVASDLPTALAWQSRPGIVTTYTGASRADELARRAPSEIVHQAATDVAQIVGHSLAPVGGAWRWTPTSRRGGCYAVFAPGDVMAHWANLRARIGGVALAGEHCGAFTGYVEGAMQSGVRAAEQLLDR